MPRWMRKPVAQMAQRLLDLVPDQSHVSMEAICKYMMGRAVLWAVAALDADPSLICDPRVVYVAEALAAHLELRVERKDWGPRFVSTLCIVRGSGDRSGMLVIRQASVVNLSMLVSHMQAVTKKETKQEDVRRTNAVHLKVCRPFLFCLCEEAHKSALTTDNQCRSTPIDESFATTA